MSCLKRALAGLAVGGCCGWIASWWCSNPAECFYIAIPPAALSYYLAGVTDLREALRTSIPRGIGIAVGIYVLAFGVASLFFEPGILLTWSFCAEVATALYYLSAVVIVLGTARRGLLLAAEMLHERCGAPASLRLVMCQVLPLVLLVLFALPYGMAFAHVHRFKLPNWTDPKRGLNREYEDVEFTSSDGTRLRGWWIPARQPSSRTLIFCHGVAANRSMFLPFAEIGDDLDANVLMFDFRGHGDSDGRTVTLGYREKDDLLAAIAYLRQKRPEQAREVIGMGVSMGAATVAEAAAVVEPPLDGVILDSSFTSTYDMTASVLNLFPPVCHDWLLTIGVPLADLHAGCPMMEVSPESGIDRLRAPVLFLHSQGDPLIPSEHSRRLYERACKPKSIYIFELDGHCDAFIVERDRYCAMVRTLNARPWLPRDHGRRDRD